MAKNTLERMLLRIERKLDTVILNLEKSHFRDYIAFVSDRKRLLRNAFIFGLVRGVGAAIGFSVLGALLWYILQAVAKSSLPIIGDFISEIVKIIESQV